ncbi:putative pentatricopeptide repeat-containing protein At1g64310 isoform X2 [Aristolochia californica]|uniref:putative pentatricopeptide repeat-containing protein At1g64310 isoform X2 n=1 Tax=Aristolochia californica TaxID=171875 RepID=UPI0035E29D26
MRISFHSLHSELLKSHNTLSKTKSLHALVIATGLAGNSFFATRILRFYVINGHLVFARQDLVSWNSILSGFANRGFWHKCLESFSKMQTLGIKPDGYTMVGLLTCFSDPNLLDVGRGVHALCLKHGLDASMHVRSALVSMYCRCNALSFAVQEFSEFSDPDLITWSSIIAGCSQLGECRHSLFFFSEMIKAAKIPDPVVIATVLAASAQLAMIQSGKEIHAYVFRHKLDSQVMVASALLDLYSKSGFFNLAVNVFEMMGERNTVTYNSMIMGLGLNGLPHKATELFKQMLENGLKPDESTFSALLSGYCHGGLVAEGRELFKRMEHKFGIIPETEHYVYMVRLLGVVGHLEEAYNLILAMPALPDSAIWGALLLGCSLHGNSHLLKIIADHLFETKPDKTAYRVMVSNIYAADGRWHDVENLRDTMIEGMPQKVPGSSLLCT